ncbi:MAG: hypothetical protein OXU96_10120 [Gammaproteobacteria bacterium]|nr:hypothetical protein [Gammaproteobacteria bacterium]
MKHLADAEHQHVEADGQFHHAGMRAEKIRQMPETRRVDVGGIMLTEPASTSTPIINRKLAEWGALAQRRGGRDWVGH